MNFLYLQQIFFLNFYFALLIQSVVIYYCAKQKKFIILAIAGVVFDIFGLRILGSKLITSIMALAIMSIFQRYVNLKFNHQALSTIYQNGIFFILSYCLELLV